MPRHLIILIGLVSLALQFVESIGGTNVSAHDFANGAIAGPFQVLRSFSGPDGETPTAALVQGADGFLYGVAPHGGDFTVLPPDGGGTAFRINADGSFTTLHVFTGPDGAAPISLVLGRDGFFYGTTYYGGPTSISSFIPGTGVLFRMDRAGKVTVLRKFVDASGGFYPGPLVVGADGALYGPAAGGVSTLNTYPGLVYRFDPATGAFTVLHNFNLSDGQDPTGPLFQGADGYLYGTTWQGGPWNTGVIYKVDPASNFTLLHVLQVFGVSEGSEPNGNLVRTADGSIYGTTHGSNGSVFRLDPNGTFNILHAFDNYVSDGGQPLSGLIQARDGFFYGTAPIGGQPTTDPNRAGVVYRVDAAGTVTVLHTFTGPDGKGPQAALVQGADGQLYGSAVVGGAFGMGVLFRVDPASAPPPPAVSLQSLTINPAQVSGGSPSTGTVALSGAAPSGGLVVALASDNTPVAGVPASVTVPQGATSASFTVTTTLVSVFTTVNISATYAGLTKTAALTVMPPVTADTVTITLAQYRLWGNKLSVQATSTSATATLTVYVTATRNLIGTLANNGGGNYSGQFTWPSNPQKITVRSSLGGSATKAVTAK
jgi:uncharacterized repeat protein (TIGR03803 family)